MSKSRPAHRLSVAAMAAALLGPAAGQAATARPDLAPEVGGVIACTQVAEPTARLACMDKAAAALQAAAGSGKLTILDQRQMQKTQRESFGLGARAPAPARAATPVDQETFEVAQAYQGSDQHWLVELKDGGRWKITEDQGFARNPKPGSRARVTRGALGSYFMALDGQPGVRAIRLN